MAETPAQPSGEELEEMVERKFEEGEDEGSDARRRQAFLSKLESDEFVEQLENRVATVRKHWHEVETETTTRAEEEARAERQRAEKRAEEASPKPVPAPVVEEPPGATIASPRRVPAAKKDPPPPLQQEEDDEEPLFGAVQAKPVQAVKSSPPPPLPPPSPQTVVATPKGATIPEENPLSEEPSSFKKELAKEDSQLGGLFGHAPPPEDPLFSGSGDTPKTQRGPPVVVATPPPSRSDPLTPMLASPYARDYENLQDEHKNIQDAEHDKNVDDSYSSYSSRGKNVGDDSVSRALQRQRELEKNATPVSAAPSTPYSSFSRPTPPYQTQQRPRYDEYEEEDPFVQAEPAPRHVTERPQRPRKTDDAAWRVTREDLILRKEELGKAAATYAFGGVFSCAMYGTAEAKDFETGEAYTEYILRCQWGRTFETMRPWMVARRFREFVAVDSNIRAALPDLAPHLPTLPAQYVFFPMSAHVIEQRQHGLEAYLKGLITELPATLKSPQIDEFLCVSDRIASMRAGDL